MRVLVLSNLSISDMPIKPNSFYRNLRDFSQERNIICYVSQYVCHFNEQMPFLIIFLFILYVNDNKEIKVQCNYADHVYFLHLNSRNIRF